MILDTTKFTYVGNGSSLRIDAAICTGCGTCVDVCPHAVFALRERKAVAVARERCMECGACRLNCQAGAVEVAQGVGCVMALVNGRRGKSGSQCGCSATECTPKGCT
jgi:NAD-dependent dihydropyrimidine dehydrogenase PreA subunit